MTVVQPDVQREGLLDVTLFYAHDPSGDWEKSHGKNDQISEDPEMAASIARKVLALHERPMLNDVKVVSGNIILKVFRPGFGYVSPDFAYLYSFGFDTEGILIYVTSWVQTSERTVEPEQAYDDVLKYLSDKYSDKGVQNTENTVAGE